MARFWVGGTGTWDASTTTHWSTTTGGAGGASAPTSADDVFIDGNSGVGTITTTSPSNTAVCRNLDFTGYTGTFSAPIGSQLLINPTAGGTIKFASGMTVTSPSQFAVSSPSGTNSNLTTNGIGNGVWNFTGSSTGGVTVVDAFTANQITLTIGTLNTNGQTCTWGIFALGSGTKTLTLGASAVTITGTSAGAWDTRTNNTNFTFNANTSSITCNGVGMSFRGGGLTYNSVTMSPGASAQTFGDNNTFTNLIFAGSAVKTNAINLSAGNTQTVTGTFTVSGNSATNRFLVATTTVGTSATINAAAVSLTNVDFMDVAATGAAAPFTGTSLGDCLGNSGITFTTPSTQTWSGTSGGNWSTNAWTSRVPLPQDTVVFSSAFSASQTVVADMPRLGKDISWIGSSGSPIWNFSISCIIYGSVNLTGVGSVSTAVVTTFLSGRSSQTITTNGKTFTIYVQINGPGGTYTLQDNLTINNLVVSNSATFTANNFNLSMANFQITTGTVNMGTGTWSLTSVSALSIWNASAVGPIINASTSTIIITNSSSNPRTFAGGGASYNTLQINGAAGAAAVTISGANTFNTFIAQANVAVAFTSGVTQTFNHFTAIGTSGNLVTITSSSGGTAATLAKVGGQVSMDFVSVQDITGSTATTWYAGTHSTNVSGNTNINFSFATTTKTISTTGGNWSATTAWMEGAVPGAGDDVVGYAGSGALTIDAASSCRSIDLTSYTSTLTHNAFTLTIGSSTANGTTALIFPSSGWTYTLADVVNSAISLSSTVASTTQTVDFGAKTTGNVTFNAATTSGYQLVNNGFNTGATASVALTQGTLNTNGMTCSWGLFSSSSSNTRTITLGASNITIAGTGTSWNFSATNLTITANTATVTMNGAGVTFVGATNWQGMSLVMNGSGTSVLGSTSVTLANFTRTGTAVKTDGFSTPAFTCTGTLTLTGNSVTNRLFVQSNTIGTSRTLTAGAVSLTNVDFMDITGAGAAAPFTGTSLGDAGGNSNITFDTPVTQSPGMAYLDGTGLVLPGVAGHYASIPNAAALQITGDIDIRCKVNVANWTSTSFQSFIGKRAGGSSTEYAFRMAATTGKLDFYWFESGASRDFVSSVAVPFANGTTQWVRATRSNTGGPAGVSQVTFYTSSDGSIWTQLGIAVNGASAANPTATTNPVLVGASSNNDGNPLIGTVYETIILNGINGTTVLDANFAGATSRATSFTESSSNAATVTVVQADVSWSTASWTSRIPLPQDSVTIPGLINSTLTSNMPRLGGSIDFTGSTGGTLTFSAVGASFGSLNFNSGLAITGNANAQLTLSGRSSYTITSHGVAFPGGANGIVITAPGGTYTLQDNALWTANFSVTAGGFNTNSFNLTCNLMTVTGSLTRSATLDNSTITMVRTSAGSIFQVTSTGLTLSAANTTFVYAQTSPNAHSFDGAGYTYGALQITGGKGTSFAITGANTFTGGVTANPDTVLTWPSSTTNTIGSLSATGQNFGYNYFPSAASNFASTPNAADLQLTGDFDFRVLVDLDSYRPTTFAALITKWDASIPNRSYSFVLNTTGTLAVSLTSDNTTSIGSTSSVSVSATPGTPIWLRATRATSTVTFYTSPDGTTWNQLGTTGTNSTTIITGTAALVVGGFGGNGSNPLGGKLYYAEVRSSVNGTIVANPDFRTKAFGANSFADTAGTPKTWTITGAQAQAGDGRVLINSSTAGVAATLSSTGRIALDYVTVQDNTASGNTPFYAGVHGVLISGDTNWLAVNAPGGSPLLMMGVG